MFSFLPCCARAPPEVRQAEEKQLQEQVPKEVVETINTLLMKEQLQQAREGLMDVIEEEITLMFENADPTSEGDISAELVKQVFVDLGWEAPDNMHIFANADKEFGRDEFADLVKFKMAQDIELACQCILLKCDKVLAWAKQSWKHGVRSKDTEDDGEVVMSVDVVVELFAFLEEINARKQLTEEDVRSKIKEVDHNSSGALSLKEYTFLYVFFLAKICEDIREDNIESAADESEEQPHENLDVFMEFLKTIRGELDEVIDDSINTAFKKLDPDGYGIVTDNLAENAFSEHVELPFNEQDDMIDANEFHRVLKSECAKTDQVARAVLRDNSRVQEWAERGWELCLQQDEDDNEESVSNYTLICILQRMDEVTGAENIRSCAAREIVKEFNRDMDDGEEGSEDATEAEFKAFFLKLLSMMFAAMAKDAAVATDAATADDAAEPETTY
eukprot:TRINITY_DN25439_c0_g1_i2.p1 TRINITY_DN25439_c0_g1~~TRINITY_DN25439_c0_g1_i2.p1  ORF type:complete len:446 (-),score=87.31 TRINITY_DN25439_c0_g1_i2:173-1510(-)